MRVNCTFRHRLLASTCVHIFRPFRAQLLQTVCLGKHFRFSVWLNTPNYCCWYGTSKMPSLAAR